MNLPTGTVTFLLTDIEGSTALWEAHPDLMGAVVDQHVKLIESAVNEHGGVLVKAKGEGDATFSVFSRPSDATAAVIDAQQALHLEPWPDGITLRSRAAIHTGEAELRDGDYYGTEVNRCARIRGVAHGGQTLLGATTASMVVLPAAASLRDLGTHGLRDLARPEHIFQLCIAELPNDFPPVRSLDTFRQNLPSQRTSFVGRDEELVLVRKYLFEHRLVTLTGVGGAGKTRLAVQVAAEALDVFPGGVFFVDLARVTDPEVIPSAISDAVGIVPATLGAPGGTSVWDDVIQALAKSDTLLLLDNCEHVIDACAKVADELLESCPSLRILATSREALEVEGEQAYTVPSLDVPDPDGERAGASVELFCDRAAGLKPGFTLTRESAAPIAEICRRLDGVPLAIELAAAQMTHLSPAQIAERLNDRFRLLTGGRRRVQRQQTLGATLDWSHDLLTQPERVLLRRLSVFPGSFTLEAAEAVGGSDLGTSVVGALRSLVNKSLVDATDEGIEVSYRMLETVRLYAEDKLLGSDESEVARRRHAEHFARLAGRTIEEVNAPSYARAVLREAHNFRAAIAWSLLADEAVIAADLVIGATPLWAASFDEASRVIDEALEMRDRLDSDRVSSLLAASAWTGGHRGDFTTMRMRALEVIDLAGPDAPTSDWLALAHGFLIAIFGTLTGMGADGARGRMEEHSSALRRMLKDLSAAMRGWAAMIIALAKNSSGDPEGSVAFFEEALRAFPAEESVDPNRAETLGAYALTLHVLGRYGDSLEIAERASLERAAWREFSSSTDVGKDLSPGAPKILALAYMDRFAEAREYASELMPGTEDTSDDAALARTLVMLAAVAVRHRDFERAARLLGAARAVNAFVQYLPLFRVHESGSQTALGDAAMTKALDEGSSMTRAEAIAYGLEGIDP